MTQDTQAERGAFEELCQATTWREGGDAKPGRFECFKAGVAWARKSVADHPEPVACALAHHGAGWIKDQARKFDPSITYKQAIEFCVEKAGMYGGQVVAMDLPARAPDEGGHTLQDALDAGYEAAPVDRPEPAQPVHEPAPTWWINQVIGDYGITGAQAEALWASVLKEANRG